MVDATQPRCDAAPSLARLEERAALPPAGPRELGADGPADGRVRRDRFVVVRAARRSPLVVVVVVVVGVVARVVVALGAEADLGQRDREAGCSF